MGNCSFTQAVEDFLTYCTVKELSRRTIEFYRANLRIFADWMRSNGMEDTINLSVQDIRRFQLYLRERKNLRGEPISPQRVNGYLRTLKALYSFLMSEGIASFNPMARVPLAKEPQKIVETFKPTDVEKILAAIPRNTKLGRRDYCMILVLYDTGVRLSELLGIKVGNIDFREGYIKVTGKGNKERKVPIGKQTKKILFEYVRREGKSADDFLFTSVRGGPLSLTGADRRICDAAKNAGIDLPRISAHTWRHTFAKEFLKAGGDIASLRVIGGWSTLDMPHRYANWTETEAKLKHAECGLVDRLARHNNRERGKE